MSVMSKSELSLKAKNNVPSDRQGYVNLQKMSLVELKELLDRQNNLLKNTSFISKLSDKGGKIIIFKSQIEQELKEREGIDSTCDLLSGLDINKTKSEDIEWNHGTFTKSSCQADRNLDSDDDDDNENNVDPLKLIATHSGTVQHTRSRKELPPEKSLITEDDLKEITEFKAPYADQLCEKYSSVEVKERFKPNKPKPGSAKPPIISARNVQQILGDKWEVTEATPPVPVYETTKEIMLPESIQLLKEQAEKVKEIERKQASEKLMRSLGIKMGSDLPVSNVTEYRIAKEVFEDTCRAGSEDEEEDEEEKGGAVFYNLIDEDGTITH